MFIEGFFQNGNADGAVGYFQEVKKSGIKPDERTVCIMINGLTQNYRFEELDNFIQPYLYDGLPYDNVECIFHLISAYFRYKSNWRRAMVIFSELKKRNSA